MRASAWPLAMHAVFLFYMVEGSVPFSELVDERLWDELTVPSASDCNCVCTCARARVRVRVYHVRARAHLCAAGRWQPGWSEAARGVVLGSGWGLDGIRCRSGFRRQQQMRSIMSMARTAEVRSHVRWRWVHLLSRERGMRRSLALGKSAWPSSARDPKAGAVGRRSHR